MFLFRWVWNLFRLALGILLLPLRLVGIPLAMVYLPFRIILKLFARHTVAFILVVLAIYLFFHFRHNNARLPELTPAQTAPVAKTPQGKMPIVEPVRKRENGDSAFATDLYATMTEEERIQYSKNYFYAMNALTDGQVHSWSSYNIAGSIRANDTFRNGSGDRCRHFNEVLKVHSIQQTISGTACEQGGGRWCKLKPNATPMCGLGGSGGFMDGITRSLRNLF